MNGPQSAILLLLFIPFACYAQTAPELSQDISGFPSHFFSQIQKKSANLDDQLTHQSEKYLRRMQRHEQRLFKKLYKVASTDAKNLFGDAAPQYTLWKQKLVNDTGGTNLHLTGEYQAYTDSLQMMLKFVNGLQPPLSNQAASALARLKTLEAKVQDADQIKAYVRQRKQVIAQYIQQHANASPQSFRIC